MKVRAQCLFLGCVLLFAGCRARTGGSGLKGVSDQDPFLSIGRGAKITLKKDIEIPANSTQALIGPFKFFTPVQGQGDTNIKTYAVCGIGVKETSVDRRILKKGTVIELNGESRTTQNSPDDPWNIEEIDVSTPSSIQSVGCTKLVASCYADLCTPYEQRPLTVEYFKAMMSDVATVDRAPPVVIPSK